MRGRSAWRLGAAFLAVASACAVAWLAATGGLADAVSALLSADPAACAACLLCSVACMALDAAAIRRASRMGDAPAPAPAAWAASACGFVAGPLTPAATGSPPAQAAALAAAGAPASSAAATQLAKYLAYQLSVTAVGLSAYVYGVLLDPGRYTPLLVVTTASAVGHVLLLLAVGACVLAPRSAARLLPLYGRLASRIRLLPGEARAARALASYADAAEALRRPGSAALFAGCVALTLAELLCQYACLPLCAAALGAGVPALDGLAAGALSHMFATCMPLPGGAGGAEWGVAVTMGSWLSDGRLAACVALWRMLTTFAQVAVGLPWALRALGKGDARGDAASGA